MSVLIKGMEMPKNCGGCFLRFGQCSRRIYMENRPSDCPLNEVPEPHGRLGDLDELKTAFPCGEYVKTESVRATIDHMRTIIPASEEGEA